jgi:hypothetical protein
MIFLKSNLSRPYQWTALIGFPILVAMGGELSFRPKDAAGQNVFGLIFIDLEILQYLFAALLAAIGGFFGLVAVAMASFVKLIRFTGEFSGYHIVHPGSIGEAAAMLSIAHLFAKPGRLRDLITSSSIAVPGTLLLLILGAVFIATHEYLGLTITTWAYIFILLCAFYYGLSSVRLLPGILLVAAIGLGSTFLQGYFDKLQPPIDLFRLLSSGPEDHWNSIYKSFVPGLGLASPWPTIIVVYVALLGRGLRKRWLTEDEDGGTDSLALGLTSLGSLVTAAVVSVLIWDFTLTLSYGWQVSMPENERYFRTAFSLLNPSAFYAVPFVAFCMGALYGTRGVWLASVCYVVLVVAVHLALPVILKNAPPFAGTRMLADAFKFTYDFYGMNLGRGLALPLYALLGTIVTRQSDFFKQPAAL